MRNRRLLTFMQNLKRMLLEKLTSETFPSFATYNRNSFSGYVNAVSICSVTQQRRGIKNTLLQIKKYKI